MRQGIVVQARLGSSRLAGKMKEELVPGANVLEFVTRSLAALDLPLVIAMPDSKDHREFAVSLDAGTKSFHFGSEADVHERFLTAADEYGFDTVVRICADNPFLNTGFLKNLIAAWNPDLDYLTFFDKSGTPAMKTHYGLFAEIASVDRLRAIRKLTTDPYYFEHVTPYFYEHPDSFRIGRLPMPEPFWSGIPLRLTLDTSADLENLRLIAGSVDVQHVEAILAFVTKTGLLARMQSEIVRNAK